MNSENVIRMAREAHRELVTEDYPGHRGQLDPWTLQLMERFAALVAAAEREDHEREIQNWMRKCQQYIAIHDAVVKDNDKLYALLERIGEEMRGKGWAESKEAALHDIYFEVARTLYPTRSIEAVEIFHPCRVFLDDDMYIAAGTDYDKLWLGHLSGEGGDFDKDAIREMLVKHYEENL